MKNLIDVIQSRKSVRSYADKKVSEEDVQQIYDCAKAAPSANGVYPWEIKVYQDKETLDLLSQTQTWANFVAEASACFVIIGYPGRSEHWIEDCSVAAENILLAVHALGLGSCWVAVRNMQYGGKPAHHYVRETLSLPDDSEVLCMIPVGHLK